MAEPVRSVRVDDERWSKLKANATALGYRNRTDLLLAMLDSLDRTVQAHVEITPPVTPVVVIVQR